MVKEQALRQVIREEIQRLQESGDVPDDILKTIAGLSREYIKEDLRKDVEVSMYSGDNQMFIRIPEDDIALRVDVERFEGSASTYGRSGDDEGQYLVEFSGEHTETKSVQFKNARSLRGEDQHDFLYALETAVNESMGW